MAKHALVIFGALIVLLVAAAAETGYSHPDGRVTKMALRAEPANYAGSCPTTIQFNGQIWVDGPNTIYYGVTRSDGAQGKGHNVVFKSGGTQEFLAYTWRLGKPGENFEGWVEIGSGNARSNKAVFHVRCEGNTRKEVR